MAETEEFAPSMCGVCPHIVDSDYNDMTFGVINLHRCNHPKGPIFVMPSELAENCPLPINPEQKHCELLPSPAQRPMLSEETIFLIEALRWYIGECCSAQIQEKVETILSNVWSNSQFPSYKDALRIIQTHTTQPAFTIIYQSIVGYQDTLRQATELFSGSTEDFFFDED